MNPQIPRYKIILLDLPQFMAPYAGPLCKNADVPLGKIYSNKEEATSDMVKLTKAMHRFADDADMFFNKQFLAVDMRTGEVVNVPIITGAK